VHAKPCPGPSLKKSKKSGGSGSESGGSSPKGGKATKSGKKAGDKAWKKMKKMERKPFKETDIQSFDDFFSKCQEPLDTICDLGEKVSTAHEQLQAFFEVEEVIAATVTPGDMQALLTYYFKEVKKVDGGDFKVELDDEGMPTLEIKGKHAGRVADFVQALTDAIDNIREFIETCPELVEQLVSFAEECSEFPSKVQDEAAGLSPLKIPGAVKKTADNVKYLGGVPNDFKEVFDEVKAFLKILKDCADATA